MSQIDDREARVQDIVSSNQVQTREQAYRYLDNEEKFLARFLDMDAENQGEARDWFYQEGAAYSHRCPTLKLAREYNTCCQRKGGSGYQMAPQVRGR